MMLDSTSTGRVGTVELAIFCCLATNEAQTISEIGFKYLEHAEENQAMQETCDLGKDVCLDLIGGGLIPRVRWTMVREQRWK